MQYIGPWLKVQKRVLHEMQFIRFFLKKYGVYKLPFACFLIFFLALFFRLWRLESAPGFYVDEPFYVDLGISMLTHGELLISGVPWFTHPPLFFVLQGLFFQIVNIHAVTLNNIILARLPTCLISSFTILIVFFWVTKASNVKTGLFSALLLMLEPYYLTFSRTGIIESTAILFIVVYLYFIWAAGVNNNLKNYVFGGIFFGLALLTKEICIYVLLIIFLWWILSRYAKMAFNLRGIITSILIGVIIYSLYFLWGLYFDGNVFLDVKINSLDNILTYFIESTSASATKSYGMNTFVSDLIRGASTYIVSYILLMFGFFISAYLIFKKKTYTGLLLSSWYLGSILFRFLLGISNVKFFVYATIPAAVILGYVAFFSWSNFENIRRKKLLKHVIVLLFLVGLMTYNVGVFYNHFASKSDVSIQQSVTWVETNVPVGTCVIAPYYYTYFLSNYSIFDVSPIWSDLTIQNVKGLSVHYFISTTHWLHELDKSTIDYITSNGTIVASFYGPWTQEVIIYYIENPI